MSNESSEWSSYPTLGLNLSSGGVISQPHNTPFHSKPPAVEDILDEENYTSTNNIVGGSNFNYLHRLQSPTEDSITRFVPSPGNAREDQPTYGNSLGVQGVVLDQVQGPISSPVQGINVDQVHGTVPNQLQNQTSDQLVQSVRRPTEPSIDADVAAAIDHNHQRDMFENVHPSSPVSINVNTCSSNISTNSNRINYVEPKSSSVANSGSAVPSQANSSMTSFPTEPTILADKYAVLGPVDASTCHGISLLNHDIIHVKAVSPRTARDVCAQQAMLVRDIGVRAPIEAVISGCGKRAWLVFPPHFGDLHSYVRLKRRLREAEAQRLFAQVATTVENCHSSGLVLRDLKLRKFVFTDSNRQHVVLESVEDSVVAGESDLLHDKHGCPAYVAPEILSSSAYSGRHADMWGLGVILYTMLVGRYPFHNGDTAALFAKIRSGKFFIPDWVSSRARHLILSLLRRQPQRRLTAEQVMLHPWLNRVPRDHVGKDAHDHIVPSNISAPCIIGKSRPS